VSITGLVDAGINQTDFKGNKVTTSAAPNGSATSNFTFLVSEDLGQGLKADARWEIDPDLNQTVGKTSGTSATGTTSNVTSFLGNGYSFLGLTSANLGSIKFGSINFETLNANGDGNLGFGTAIGSGYRVTSFDAVRAQNSVRLDTPSFMGLSASFLQSRQNALQANVLSTGQTGNQVNQTVGRDGVTEIGAAYNQGPLVVRAAQLKVKQFGDISTTTTAGQSFVPTAWANGTGAQFKLNTLSAKYQVTSDAAVAFFHQSITSDALIVGNSAGTGTSTTVYDRKTNGVAATYQVTPMLKLMANYQQAKNGANANSAGTAKANLHTNVAGLGADYSLSKRTTAYFRMEHDMDSIGQRSITGYTAATGNVTYKATAVGIRHTF
jgi:predicted porin